MSVKKTFMTVMEMTCDNCGKEQVETYIQGISDEGMVALPTTWVYFAVSTAKTSMAHETLACSKACYLDLCGREYEAGRST